MRLLRNLLEYTTELDLATEIEKLYDRFDECCDDMPEKMGEQWDTIADRMDHAMEEGHFEQAEAHLAQLQGMLEDFLGEQCEEIWVDEFGNEIVSEAARRAFKRVGKQIKRRYRCTTGMKKGKVVSDPKLCATRKDPKKVRLGRRVARTRKGVRIRKSAISKRTAMSKMVRRMNQRLSGPTARKPSKPM